MKKTNIFKIVIFLGFIFSLSIMTIFMMIKYRNKDLFLAEEQRYSAPFPKLDSLSEDIKSGKFNSDFEKYYSDRVFRRSLMLKYKTIFDVKYSRKRHISDVILSQDRSKAFRYRLSDKEADNNKINDELQSWRKIKTELDRMGTNIIIVAVPDQSHMYPDQYPRGAYNDYDRFVGMRDTFLKGLDKYGIDYIDLYPIAMKDRDYYYTNGDHHQNFKLTMAAYEKILEKLDGSSLNLFDVREESDLITSNKKFIGSHNRKLFEILDEPYKQEYLKPKKDIEYTRYDNGKKTETPIFADTKYYSSYMGGDNAETIIDTNRPNLPNIMVLGDSTSNALESIIWMNSNKFTSLDYRHFKGDGLVEYVKKHPQDLIVVSLISGSYVYLNEIMR